MNNICSVFLGFYLEMKLSFIPTIAEPSREETCLIVVRVEIIACIGLESLSWMGIIPHGFLLSVIDLWALVFYISNCRQ